MHRIRSLITKSVVAALLLTVAIIGRAAQQESIVVDPLSRDYVVNYSGSDEQGNEVLQQVLFVPATKIDPVLRSKFSEVKDGGFQYHYKIRSGAKSQQNVDFVLMMVSTVKPNSLVSPDSWSGSANTNLQGEGYRIGWAHWKRNNVYAGLVPGTSQGGFGFMSDNLPGVGLARLRGATPVMGFPDE